MTPAAARALVRTALKSDRDESSEEPARLVAAAMSAVLGHGNHELFQKMARNIKTEDELANEIAQIRRIGNEQVPTIARKWVKEWILTLPRRGGPGRTRLLSPAEATFVCDHIGKLTRRKLTVRAALQQLSAESQQLLGKKVGMRTLQKAWDERDKH